MNSLLASIKVQENPTSLAYISYLTSLTLREIDAQTTKLGAELQSVNQSLTALALREASSFSSSTADVLLPIPDILTTITTLEDQIPAVDSAATFNTARLQEVAQSRKDVALLARSETQIQELLDLPGMLQTCVQNGHYNEATDLSLHLRRIQARHPRSTLLKSLVRECDEHMQRMALQLLHLLHTPLKLAMALKVIGFLRRSGQFEEQELQFLFLKGRYDALQDAWAETTPLKDSPERYVKKYVEIFREQVFAIITQYTSVFPTQENASARPGTEESFQRNLLPSFCQQVIATLADMIKEYLPKIDSQATKNTLLTQVLYTSQSLSRVGCEFAGLVISSFGEEKDWSAVVINQRQMARKLD